LLTHDRKASDGVVATNMTNIDTAITATGMGTLRLRIRMLPPPRYHLW
jgi:hypothetical protein